MVRELLVAGAASAGRGRAGVWTEGGDEVARTGAGGRRLHHRGIRDDAAPDELDGVRAQPREARVQAGDLGQLVQQVDDLLDPADKVAGGQVRAAEDVLEVPALGPLEDRPDQAQFGFPGQRQLVRFLDVLQGGPLPDHDVDGGFQRDAGHPRAAARGPRAWPGTPGRSPGRRLRRRRGR